MRRRIASLLAVGLLAAVIGVLVPSSPASGGVHVCGGAGTATTGAGLLYPVSAVPPVTGLLPPLPHPHIVVHQATNTTFGFEFSIAGACANTNPTPPGPGNVKLTVTANGVVSGWCGLSSGSGVLNLGASPRFAWIGIGGFLVLTGGLIGIVNAVPNVAAGESCNGLPHQGADNFIVTGAAIAFDHCALKSKGLTPVTVPTGGLTTVNLLPAATVSIHSEGNWHIWTKVCAPTPLL